MVFFFAQRALCSSLCTAFCIQQCNYGYKEERESKDLKKWKEKKKPLRVSRAERVEEEGD